MRRYYQIFLISLCGLMLLGLGGPVVEKNRAGNRQYQAGQYDRSMTSYVEAKSHVEEGTDEAVRIHFNIGDALYQQGKYEDARKEYEQALGSQSFELRAKAAYNTGNTFFKQALQSQKIEDLEKAAEYYTKTLELMPDDQDAKFNLEVVRRHIDLKNQQQQQSCDNKKQQNQQGEKDQQQDKDQQQQDQQQQDQQAEQQPEPQQGDSVEKQPEPKQAQGEQQPPEEMSKQEALRLLDSLKQQEEEMQKERIYRHSRRTKAEKDW